MLFLYVYLAFFFARPKVELANFDLANYEQAKKIDPGPDSKTKKNI